MNPTLESYTLSVSERVKNEKAATALIKLVGDLFFDRNVRAVLYRQPLVDQRPSEMLQAHVHASIMAGESLSINDTLAIAEALTASKVQNASVDIGRLATEWKREAGIFLNRKAFLDAKLRGYCNGDNPNTDPVDVVLYGFGRIGRLVARELIAQEGRGTQLRLRAIVARGSDPMSLEKRASLLRVDSIHGSFPGTVEADHDHQQLIINGRPVAIVSADAPEDIDYEALGIQNALVVDNTGAFRDKEALSRHLASKGIAKVLLTAPGKGVPNIVFGVNHMGEHQNDAIQSAASCTTNAITPVLKVIQDQFGIVQGHIETIHAYTNDQNLVDNMHKKYRRGRAAAVNMVITETGAGQAVDKAIPGLGSKLTSNAIRVPVPNGSLAILKLNLEKATDRDGLNAALKAAAFSGPLVEQIKYSVSPELVSSDIVGDSCCSIFDSEATIVHSDGKNVVLYVWYDNEYGYTRQVMRLAKHMAGVRRKSYY
jgi:glyceraldehyde 3-phosphate dehydrogenase